jgi:hypothetical protein
MENSILKEHFEKLLYEGGAENNEQIEGAHVVASIFCKALVTIMKEDLSIEPLPLIAEYIITQHTLHNS